MVKDGVVDVVEVVVFRLELEADAGRLHEN
jgi:hypothetical protein